MSMVSKNSSNDRRYAIIKSLNKAQIDRISQLTNTPNDLNEFRNIVNKPTLKDGSTYAQIKLVKQANNHFFYNPDKTDIIYLKRKNIISSQNPSNNLQIALNNQQNFLKRNKQNIVPVKPKKLKRGISSVNLNDYLSLFSGNHIHITPNYYKVEFSVIDYDDVKEVYNLISKNFSNQNFMQFLRLNLILQQFRITISFNDVSNNEQHFSISYYSINDYLKALNMIDSYIQETNNSEEFYNAQNEIQNFIAFTIYYR